MKILCTSIMILMSYCLLTSQSLEAEVSPNGITFPSMTTWQRNNLHPLVDGQCIFNSESKNIQCYTDVAGTGQWVSYHSLDENSIYNRNVHYGWKTGRFGSGKYNTAFGYGAEGPLDGNGNTLLGFRAGEDMQSGNYNTFLGSGAGREANGDNNIFIGPGTGGHLYTSNTLIIEGGTYPVGDPLIYGDFKDNYLTINGTVNISQLIKLQALDTAPTCDAEAFGSVYMNAASETLQLCTSSGWKALSMEP